MKSEPTRNYEIACHQRITSPAFTTTATYVTFLRPRELSRMLCNWRCKNIVVIDLFFVLNIVFEYEDPYSKTIFLLGR